MTAARSTLVCVLPLLLSTACYRYVPVQTVQPGMDVRAQLTSAAAVRRSEGHDEPIMRYEGIIVGVASDTVTLDVLVARASGALQDVVIRDTLSIPTAEIQTILRRKLSVTKSALFTLAAGASAVAIVVGIDQVVGGTGEPPGGPPPAFRPPWFSFHTLRLLLGLR
jgi:hypothetical protein